MLVMSNFSVSHSVFYPFEKLSTVFIKSENVVCKLFQFGRVKDLWFGEGLIETDQPGKHRNVALVVAYPTCDLEVAG